MNYYLIILAIKLNAWKLEKISNIEKTRRLWKKKIINGWVLVNINEN